MDIFKRQSRFELFQKQSDVIPYEMGRIDEMDQQLEESKGNILLQSQSKLQAKAQTFPNNSKGNSSGNPEEKKNVNSSN